MEPFLGIDFGTTTSSMAWVDPKTGKAFILKNAEREEKTPSQVYFGEQQVAIGKAAEDWLQDDPQGYNRLAISVKRLLATNAPLPHRLNGNRVRPSDVATLIIGKLKRDAETLHFHQPVYKAVITVPATFDILEKDRIKAAAQQAGFQEVLTLEEPVAAALAYARDGMKPGKHILVYDLGGGTLDLALIRQTGTGEQQRFEVALPQSGARLGGDDFDRALYDHLDDWTQKNHQRGLGTDDHYDLNLLRRCRDIKETLSRKEQTQPSLMLSGTTCIKPPITRDDFEALIHTPVQQTLSLTQELIQKAQEARCPVETLVLIGGSTQIPQIRRALEALANQSLHLQLQEWEKSDVAVALGAAYHAGERWGQRLKPIPVPPRPDPVPEPEPQPKPAAKLKPEPKPTTPARPKEYRDPVTGMEFVWIEGGSFLMGSPPKTYTTPLFGIEPLRGLADTTETLYADERQHPVSVTGFYLGKYPVTNAQYCRFKSGHNSGITSRVYGLNGYNQPVVEVSWHDAVDFADWLSQQTGKHYRLPTEAEWEYACRAGTTTAYSFGDDVDRLGDHAWYEDNANGQTHPVGQKRPNPWGLHDMHGNVWEWTGSVYNKDYGGAETRCSGKNDASHRALRGGSWSYGPGTVRSAARGGDFVSPGYRGSGIGFRLARIVSP